MIKSCPNCGGLFCTPPDNTFAGRACNCGYSETVALSIVELQAENTKLREEVERLKQQLKKFGSGVDFFSWGKVKAHLPVPLAKELTRLQYETDEVVQRDNLQSQLSQAREELATKKVCKHNHEASNCMMCAAEKEVSYSSELTKWKKCAEAERLDKMEAIKQLNQSNSLVLELREALKPIADIPNWYPGEDNQPYWIRSGKHPQEIVRDALSLTTPTSTNYIPREEYERVVEALKLIKKLNQQKMIAYFDTEHDEKDVKAAIEFLKDRSAETFAGFWCEFDEIANAAIEKSTQLLKGGQ